MSRAMLLTVVMLLNRKPSCLITYDPSFHTHSSLSFSFSFPFGLGRSLSHAPWIE